MFTSPSHWAVEAARAEGVPARMLPGISAEDCLFADLGVDPGDGACHSMEATELILRGRVPATDSHLIVWQIGVVGQRGLQQSASRIDQLVAYLSRFYPGDHEVVHYQAATSVLAEPTRTRVALADLADVPLAVTSTLYVPPLIERPVDTAAVTALGMDVELDVGVEEVADADTWYRPPAATESRLAALLTALSVDPSLVEGVADDPAPYVAALGLDVIEAWAFLARDQRWIDACIHAGSGPAAAVALGAAATEDEARGFFVHRDGRLVRRKQPAEVTTPGRRPG